MLNEIENVYVQFLNQIPILYGKKNDDIYLDLLLKYAVVRTVFDELSFYKYAFEEISNTQIYQIEMNHLPRTMELARLKLDQLTDDSDVVAELLRIVDDHDDAGQHIQSTYDELFKTTQRVLDCILKLEPGEMALQIFQKNQFLDLEFRLTSDKFEPVFGNMMDTKPAIDQFVFGWQEMAKLLSRNVNAAIVILNTVMNKVISDINANAAIADKMQAIEFVKNHMAAVQLQINQIKNEFDIEHERVLRISSITLH